MPGIIKSKESTNGNVTIKKLHPTFAAEIRGVDFSTGAPSENVFTQILAAVTMYGVVVLRSTNLTDESHVEFARRFGELDDIKPYVAAGRKNRLKYVELFDVSNVESDGSLVDPEGPRGQANKGNDVFHVDSSFNPRRAGYSLLLAHELPPSGMGGHTAFADTRAAFDDLGADLKEELLSKDYVANHSMHHSRKLAAPEFFANINPLEYPMGRHRLVQRHEASGRMNLYIASHIHHLESDEPGKAKMLFDQLYEHATQPKYTVEIEWENPGDLVIWDNTCTMHRAVGGPFVRKYRRDMRRATVHDNSTQAWGLNEHSDVRKYTVGSTGVWEIIRKFFAVDPNRSTGVPLKHYRNPPPGGLDPVTYDDPTTTPAADIADNPYWKRDVRRNYPKLSAVTQGDVVGLLTVGSASSPNPKLLAGEEGGKQLVAAKQEGEKGLSAYFEQAKATSVLGENGLPPMPVSSRTGTNTKYELGEQAYGGNYPCRTFV